MTAEQAFLPIRTLINQVKDSGERIKLENLILGAVESKERRKARILENLESKPRYQQTIKKSTKKIKQ